MADIAHTKTDQKLEEMEKRLSAIYSRAEKEIGERWKEYLVESQAEIDELQKAYEIAKKGGDAKEIKKAGKKLASAKRERTLMDRRFKALTETTAAQLANVNKTALAYVNGQLPEVYSINYNALSPSVDGVGGYTFALVDADTVKNLATTDKSLLPFKKLDEKKDIRWNVKKMNAEVLQGILQGEPMEKIAGRLSKVTEMNETAAIRNARTMVTGAENKGRQDSYARAEADGIILQKEWVSTNDGRTRHSHAVLDGAIVDQDKKFDNGLMYPGDPSGRPEEVYNCRCTLAAKVNGFKKAQVQKAMEEKRMGIEDAKTISDVETAFRNQDWFIHGDGSLAGWRSDDALSLDGLDVESAKYVYRTYERFFDKFPQMRGKLAAPVSAKKDRTVYADCVVGFGNGGISINKSRFFDYGKFQKSISDDFAKGWFSSKDIIMHELGHAMDDFLSVNQHLFGVNGKSRSDFVSHKIRARILRDSGIKVGDIRTEVSEYATTNQQEWFAEVFAEYMSSESPRKCASSFGKWLEEVMAEVK